MSAIQSPVPLAGGESAVAPDERDIGGKDGRRIPPQDQPDLGHRVACVGFQA
jgi:hypothetical protein